MSQSAGRAHSLRIVVIVPAYRRGGKPETHPTVGPFPTAAPQRPGCTQKGTCHIGNAASCRPAFVRLPIDTAGLCRLGSRMSLPLSLPIAAFVGNGLVDL